MDTLFPLPESARPREEEVRGWAKPRVQEANRSQVELRAVDLEALLSADHRARVVWAFVEGLDLSPFYASIRAVEGHAGRSPIDPKILLALWLYATLEGVGSARALERLCGSHDAYRWIAGGVSVNYHTLADFRVDHVEELDGLLTQSVAALMAAGAVKLRRVAQDGMRVRASAGAASFRRKTTLEACLEAAEAQVKALREELEADAGATARRQRAAQERAARERQARVAKALEHLPEVAAKKKVKEREQARASTTDPEARVMKMADGGFRPAFNAQLATDTESQVVVGVAVTNSGSDQGQMSPMVEQLEERYGRTAEAWLVDGGFAALAEIERVSQAGSTVYAPVMEPRDPTRDPHEPRPGDSPEVAAWRQRMGTEEAKTIYKERAATSECVNAHSRNRGLQQFPVRGVSKGTALVLWYALAHNVLRTAALLGLGAGIT